MPRYHRQWSPADDARIRSEYPSVYLLDLAQEFRVTLSALVQRAHSLGIRREAGTRIHGRKGTKTGDCIEKGYRILYFAGMPPVREHRHVMEKFLRRKLRPEEVVHHMNGDKLDNRIRNLKVFKNEAEHWQWHREHPEVGSPNPRRVMRTPIEGCLLCTDCGETKQVEEFNAEKSRASGYSQYCRSCLKTKNRENHERRKALTNKPG